MAGLITSKRADKQLVDVPVYWLCARTQKECGACAGFAINYVYIKAGMTTAAFAQLIILNLWFMRSMLLSLVAVMSDSDHTVTQHGAQRAYPVVQPRVSEL